MTSDKVMMKPGHQAADGTIFVGVSPKNGRDMYTLPVDAGLMNWSAAHKYARRCHTGGHRDWRLPSLDEAAVLLSARGQGALKDTFARRSYWTNEPHDYEVNLSNRIIASGRTGLRPNGDTNLFKEEQALAVRLIRTPGASGGSLSRFIARLGF